MKLILINENNHYIHNKSGEGKVFIPISLKSDIIQKEGWVTYI